MCAVRLCFFYFCPTLSLYNICVAGYLTGTSSFIYHVLLGRGQKWLSTASCLLLMSKYGPIVLSVFCYVYAQTRLKCNSMFSALFLVFNYVMGVITFPSHFSHYVSQNFQLFRSDSEHQILVVYLFIMSSLLPCILYYTLLFSAFVCINYAKI